MQSVLYEYNLDLTTWVYLSSLLALTVYFKFSPLWRVRNLDMLALVALAPAFVMLQTESSQRAGYLWLLAVEGLFLLRLLLDPLMVRRPLLEPNLNAGGLTFLGTALLIFLTAHIATRGLQAEESFPVVSPHRLTEEGTPEPLPAELAAVTGTDPRLPQQKGVPSVGNPLIVRLGNSRRSATPPVSPDRSAHFSTKNTSTENTSTENTSTESTSPESTSTENAPTEHSPTEHSPTEHSPRASTDGWAALPAVEILARVLAIVSLLAAVGGIIAVGRLHFGRAQTGVAVATLYLLLPGTAVGVDRVDQVLPSALLIWAIVAYRLPLVSGLLIGIAASTIYYPIFLVPLWCAFYWPRGIIRFLAGVAFSLVVCITVTVVTTGFGNFTWHLLQTFGWLRLEVATDHGLWGQVFQPAYRLPVQVAFGAMCLTFMLWPVEKNLGTLLSCSAAVMLATQFWHPVGGGLYLGWYLPLLLLTAFRPNLQDRVALVVEEMNWFGRRRPREHSLAA